MKRYLPELDAIDPKRYEPTYERFVFYFDIDGPVNENALLCEDSQWRAAKFIASLPLHQTEERIFGIYRDYLRLLFRLRITEQELIRAEATLKCTYPTAALRQSSNGRSAALCARIASLKQRKWEVNLSATWLRAIIALVMIITDRSDHAHATSVSLLFPHATNSVDPRKRLPDFNIEM